VENVEISLSCPDSQENDMEKERVGRRRIRGIIGPLVLIGIGTVFLLEKNGIIDRHLISQWWPALLIVIGVALLASRSEGNHG
jgi:hypothetical protein